MVTFNILNFTKKQSLYNQGMRVAVKTSRKDWHRSGFDIKYQQSRLSQTLEGFENAKKYSELCFTYNFEFKNDTVYFAYCVPYTFSRMQTHLKTLKATKQSILKEDRLCYSLSGLPVPILTVTSKLRRDTEPNSPVEIDPNEFKTDSAPEH